MVLEQLRNAFGFEEEEAMMVNVFFVFFRLHNIHVLTIPDVLPKETIVAILPCENNLLSV